MNIKGFKNLVDSLNHYHRITNEKLAGDLEADMELVKLLYVDLLPHEGVLEYVLGRRTGFLVGRRGTGKSTIFARAQSKIRDNKDYFSVYINAKSIYKDCEASKLNFDENDNRIFSTEELFKISLIDQTIKSIRESLLEEIKMEENGFFDKLKNIFRDNKIESIFTEINDLIDKPLYKSISKIIEEDKEEKNSSEQIAELKASLEQRNLSGGLSSKKGMTQQKSYNDVLAKFFNVGDIAKKFIELTIKCRRKGIYIFIDDYSELNKNARKIFMKTIIEPFYNIGTDYIYLKIAAYPNKYQPITLDHGKYDLKVIDLFDIYGLGNNITMTEVKAMEYTKKILQNRLEIYCDNNALGTFFDTNQDEVIKQLYQASKNVPRSLGRILSLCYQEAIVSDKRVSQTILEYCIQRFYEENVQVYFSAGKAAEFDSLDDKIDIYVQENLLNDLVNTAQVNKYELPKTANTYFSNLSQAFTSHFSITEEYAEFLDVLEFNGFIHRLNRFAAKGRSSDSYRNKENFLYSFDYGLCIKEKIEYGRPADKDTKYYQQRAFVYDDILMSSLSQNKKIKCKECGEEYNISELESFKKFKMKCRECDKGICEIVFDRSLKEVAEKALKEAVCTKEEIDILEAIWYLFSVENEKTVYAREISLNSDYNSNTIAWKCKKLEEIGFIKRNVYSTPILYELTERGKIYIDQILGRRL